MDAGIIAFWEFKRKRRQPILGLPPVFGNRSTHLADRIHGADFHALGVVGALGLVDHVGAVLFRDGCFGALWFAGAAGDADVGVYTMGHFSIPFGLQTRGSVGCVKNSTTPRNLSICIGIDKHHFTPV